MTAFAFLFWAGIALVVYTYALYPILLSLCSAAHQLCSDWRYLNRPATRRVRSAGPTPEVAVLVAAFNEERHIAERVRNLLNQTYEPSRLRVYVGSDASNDATASLLRGIDDPRLTFVDFQTRRGKASVINDLAAMADEEILVMTDANTSFDAAAVEKLVRHFSQPEVGCVCGELRLVKGEAGGDNQDHFYWRYERVLKFFESRIGGLLGANGGVYALRRSLYAPIPPNTIVDDFWISMQVVEQRRRCVYDPEAVATETIPESIGDEFRRRVRIGIGNYQSLKRFLGMLDPRRGVVAFTFFSHKVLRWLAPHCMLIALISNLMLVADPFYGWWFAAQCAFYGSALIGWRLSSRGSTPRPLRIPLFFVSMNVGLLLGSWKFVTQASSGVWSRSAR